jgi:hypothetical protein
MNTKFLWGNILENSHLYGRKRYRGIALRRMLGKYVIFEDGTWMEEARMSGGSLLFWTFMFYYQWVSHLHVVVESCYQASFVRRRTGKTCYTSQVRLTVSHFKMQKRFVDRLVQFSGPWIQFTIFIEWKILQQWIQEWCFTKEENMTFFELLIST